MSSIVKAKSISGLGISDSYSDEEKNSRYKNKGQFESSAESHQEMILQAIRRSRHIDIEAAKRAENIIEKANRTKKEIQDEAIKKGFAEGIELGKAAGRKDSNAQFEKALQEIETIVEAVRKERISWIENQKDDLANVSLEIARKIMKQQINTSDEAILKMLEDVIHENRNETSIKIYLSEYSKTMDLKVDKALSEKIRNIAKNISVSLIKEEDVIMIETSSGIVDISFASQMENIKEAIINTF